MQLHWLSKQSTVVSTISKI
uniref:Uncharacterized protein n=1 Tax=Anguilla anguilla TaxID=7936 RepID=A0A0E9U4X2_ANGAN